MALVCMGAGPGEVTDGCCKQTERNGGGKEHCEEQNRKRERERKMVVERNTVKNRQHNTPLSEFSEQMSNKERQAYLGRSVESIKLQSSQPGTRLKQTKNSYQIRYLS